MKIADEKGVEEIHCPKCGTPVRRFEETCLLMRLSWWWMTRVMGYREVSMREYRDSVTKLNEEREMKCQKCWENEAVEGGLRCKECLRKLSELCGCLTE